ncbi:MAG: Ig-like domain-containing protein [Tannerella sp.]|nr:Ig-like domain-containing protein [Tannerella sp.]
MQSGKVWTAKFAHNYSWIWFERLTNSNGEISGTGGEIIIHFRESGATSNREDVLVTIGGIQYEVPLYQEGTTLEVSPLSTMSFEATGGEKELTLTSFSTTLWEATSSVDWLTLTPSSGSGSKTITVKADENKTVTAADQRSAKITIKTINVAQNVTKEINVTQREPLPSLTYTPEAIPTFTSAGGSITVRVSSNVVWLVSVEETDRSWVSVSPDRGSLSGSFVISVESNPWSAARGSKVTLRGGGSITREISFTQSATTDGPDSVALSSKRLWVRPGETKQLTATIYPSAMQNKSVIWASDDPGIATVIDGWVVGVSKGQTSVRVFTVEGGRTAACLVLVDAVNPDASEDVEATHMYAAVDGPGKLTVSSPAAEQISIYSVGGAALMQVQKTAGIVAIDVSGLPRGVLIVRGSSGWTEKIVVQ